MSPATEPVGPVFLGIGVPKGATTWLHQVLDSHPDVWVPRLREVHYLSRDHHFARGMDWYLSLFPGADSQGEYASRGEISPTYLYCDPERIQFVREHIPSVGKLILIVRNPIERAWSHYWFFKRVGALSDGQEFDDFLKDRKISIERGLYAKYLNNWLQHFQDEQVLVLVFEEIFADKAKAIAQISTFLNIDPDKFSSQAIEDKVNKRFTPRFPRAYAFAVKVAAFLRKLNLYDVVFRLNKLALKLLGGGKKQVEKAVMPEATRDELRAEFADDVRQLEQYLGRTI